MSKYATVESFEDLNDDDWWAVSVNVVDTHQPIRFDHGDKSWYLPEKTVDTLIAEVLRVRAKGEQ